MAGLGGGGRAEGRGRPRSGGRLGGGYNIQIIIRAKGRCRDHKCLNASHVEKQPIGKLFAEDGAPRDFATKLDLRGRGRVVGTKHFVHPFILATLDWTRDCVPARSRVADVHCMRLVTLGGRTSLPAVHNSPHPVLHQLLWIREGPSTMDVLAAATRRSIPPKVKWTCPFVTQSD